MVPSLVSCCLSALVPYADQIQLPVSLRLRPHDTLLDDLVPDPAELDPSLWAVLVQVYETLPPYFRSKTLPLASPHVPLLQSLAPTQNFSLITLLNLSNCSDLTDDTILLFKGLHTLVGLDASCTSITSHAIYALGAILQHDCNEDAVRGHRGPWELRVVSLRNCKQIKDDVYAYLNKFPLLAVVDLRGTQCKPPKDSVFEACPSSSFHYPVSLADSVAELQLVQPELFVSEKPYVLNIDKLKLPEVRRKHVPVVAPKDAFVVIPANPFRPVRVGNTNVLELQKQRAEEAEKHERNKEAWYERQERIEERQFNMTDDDFSGKSGYHVSDRDPNWTRQMDNDSTSSALSKPRPRLCVPRLSGNRVPSFKPKSMSGANAARFGAPEYRTITRPNPPTAPALQAPPPLAATNVAPQLRPMAPNHILGGRVAGPSSGTTPSSSSSSPSPAASFYRRPLPDMAKRKQPERLNVKPLEMRELKPGEAELMLYRKPPPYSRLSSALAGSSSSKSSRADGHNPLQFVEVETKSISAKSTPVAATQARVDQKSTRAEKARLAMQLAVESRMSSASVASSSASSLEPPSSTSEENVLNKRRQFETLLPANSFRVSTRDRQRPPQYHNPFRKPIPLWVDDSASQVSKNQAGVDSKTHSRKAAHRHSIGTSGSASLSAPLLRTSRSVTDMRSSEFSTASISASASTSALSSSSISSSGVSSFNGKVGYRSAPRPPSPSNNNNKPLVPISAIKIPILPEPLRKEVARQEKAELERIKKSLERKRKKRDRDRGRDGSGDDPTDSDEAEQKRALKKRASLAKIGAGARIGARATDGVGVGDGDAVMEEAAKAGGSASASGSRKLAPSAHKGKGKAPARKKGGFDWNEWAKK